LYLSIHYLQGAYDRTNDLQFRFAIGINTRIHSLLIH
jgi:hypothetical protein